MEAAAVAREPRGIETVTTISAVRRRVARWRRQDLSVGVVPTMGALHAGHLSLVEHAVRDCDRVVATLFVNPLQFGPGEDYETYPRDEQADEAKLDAAGCHVLFAPAVAEMFPDPASPPEAFLTVVDVPRLSERLCGAARPGHFQGMATEVTKLLMITAGDVAYFGEKDYQQLQVVRRMVRDLDIPVRIEGVPTVREPDGLALSSRNAYLTAGERRVAPLLHRTLRRVAAALGDPARPIAPVLRAATDELLDGGFSSVDYLEAVDADTLEPLQRVDRPARVLAAAWLGRARLIDNVAV